MCEILFHGCIIQKYFNAKATANDILIAVIPKAKERENYALYNCFNEIYPNTELVWNMLSDPSVDKVRVQKILIPVSLKCSEYPGVKVDFLLDPNLTMSYYKDLIGLKFGLEPKTIREYRINKKGTNLARVQSLEAIELDDFESEPRKKKEYGLLDILEEDGSDLYDTEIPIEMNIEKIGLHNQQEIFVRTIRIKKASSMNLKPAPIPENMLFSLPQLIDMLTNTDTAGHLTLVESFLMTYSTFTTAETILSELKRRFWSFTKVPRNQY
jgi:hypothetical protein